MRHDPTHSEWILWQVLRRKPLGICFRRQVVLQGYIADFYAAEARFIVEVDGAYHAQRARADARRDRQLQAAGYRVLYITAGSVLTNLPSVIAKIRAAL